LGIAQDERKMILGLRQGATENATVVGELLGDLLSRGLDFTEPRLYVLDGGKALTAAVKSTPASQRRSSAARSISAGMCWII
jgi:putative transposase